MSYQVTIYTDGSAKGNPGPGGYGVVLISGQHRKELSKGFKLTTNNRMELMAVIAGLEALKKEGCDVTIYTDSQYIANSVEKGWVFEWEKKRFAKKKNADLWKKFLELYRRHNVKIIWIQGHNNIPENEYCDLLANKASENNDLEEDLGYINDFENTPFK